MRSVRLDRSVLERVADGLFPAARKVGLAAAQAEPTAVDFEFFVERALRYGVYLDVVTNGSLLTGERYREARDAFDFLDVSVDCHIPEIYESIRLGARFATLQRNLAEILEVRAHEPDEVLYTFSAVVMASNLHELPGLVRFAHQMGAHALVLKRLNHDVKPTPEEDPLVRFGLGEMRRVMTRCAAVARQLGINLVRAGCGQTGYKVPLDQVILPTARFPRGAAMAGERLCWYLAQGFHVLQTGEGALPPQPAGTARERLGRSPRTDHHHTVRVRKGRTHLDRRDRTDPGRADQVNVRDQPGRSRTPDPVAICRVVVGRDE